MRSSVLDKRPGPEIERPPTPPGRQRAIIALHGGIVTIAAAGYLITGWITGVWTPDPWPAGLMVGYLAGVVGIIGYSVWRGVTGRASIDTESLDAIKSRCLREADRNPWPVSAVALRPVLPHPCTGWVFATVTAERLGPASPGVHDVRLRTTPGWALTRRTAWHRGLDLTGFTDGEVTPDSDRSLGPVEDAPAPRPALNARQRSRHAVPGPALAGGRFQRR